MRPPCLDRLVLYVSDLRLTAHFYENIVGLRKIVDDRYSIVFESEGIGRLSLAQARKGVVASRRVCLDFVVEDLNEFKKHVVDRLPLDRIVSSTVEEGTLALAITDPSGNLVRIAEKPGLKR